MLAGLLALPAAAGAQELDAGELQVRVDGRRVAVERFRVWRSGSTVNAVARIERTQQAEWQVGLQMDADFRPMKYELQEGRAGLVSGERFADRVRFHTVSDDGERWKEYPARSIGAILEDGVAHHYLLLVQLLRAAPGGQAEILMPIQGRTTVVRLTGQAPERVSIGDRSVAATRYDVDVDGAVHGVWLDAANKLLRVVDPRTGREAVRLPTEG